MSFEISTFRIDDDSPEGQNLQAIIRRERVSPEEAIRRALRNPAVAEKTPAQEMMGLFSSDEDAALMDEVMALAEESRRTHTTRDIGL